MRKFFKVMFLLIMIFMSREINASTSLTYEYDANGNLIRGDGKYYEYNDSNQLIKVRHGDASGPVIAEYFYDYTGQRIKKVENGITTYYVGKHFEKQVDSVGTATNTSYYFANNERVAKIDSSGNVYYYHSDHLGGTNVITDSSGNLVERIKYYPFGEIREGGNEKYSFTGKEKDNLTDYYYFEARYYDSDFEHFTQADTIEPDLYEPQHLNRYAYVANNPIRFKDPSGLFITDWLGEKIFQYTSGGISSNADYKAQAAYYNELSGGLERVAKGVETFKKGVDYTVTVLSMGVPGGSEISTAYSLLDRAIMSSPELRAGNSTAWKEFVAESLFDIALYGVGEYRSLKVHPNARWTWKQALSGRIGPKRLKDFERKANDILMHKFMEINRNHNKTK